MIIGLGTDIIELKRMQRSLDKGKEFERLVFSSEEVAYCKKQGKSLASFSGRFAAKEALLKALGTGWVGEMKLYDIVVLNNNEGKPYFDLRNEVKEKANSIGATSVHLSITHSNDYASAVVIIEK